MPKPLFEDQAAYGRFSESAVEKKAKLNIGLLCCDGAMDAVRHRNNCYFLRPCIALHQRALDGGRTIDQLGTHVLEPLFVDPRFAGDPGRDGHPDDKSGFGPDRMMSPAIRLDFDSFFSTNPELVQRGIGLDPAAFRDFRFTQETKTTLP